jgi:hypothetical protein
MCYSQSREQNRPKPYTQWCIALESYYVIYVCDGLCATKTQDSQ